MLPAFFWRFFFLYVLHVVTLMGAGVASVKLFEQVGNQYCQANDDANECFPILKHDFPHPKKLMTGTCHFCSSLPQRFVFHFMVVVIGEVLDR
jgi:hypothetical protein